MEVVDKYPNIARYANIDTLYTFLENPNEDNIASLMENLEDAIGKFHEKRFALNEVQKVPKSFTSSLCCSYCRSQVTYVHKTDKLVQSVNLDTLDTRERLQEIRSIRKVLQTSLTYYDRELRLLSPPVPKVKEAGEEEDKKPDKKSKKNKKENSLTKVTEAEASPTPTVITQSPLPTSPEEEKDPYRDYTLQIYPGFLTDICTNQHMCTQCKYIAKTTYSRRKHNCQGETIGELTCKYCNKAFLYKNSYNQHIRVCEIKCSTNLVAVPRDLNIPIQYDISELVPKDIQARHFDKPYSIFIQLMCDIIVKENNRCFKKTCKSEEPRLLQVHRGYTQFDYQDTNTCLLQILLGVSHTIKEFILTNELTTKMIILLEQYGSRSIRDIGYSMFSVVKCANTIIERINEAFETDCKIIKKQVFVDHFDMFRLIRDTI